jgi:chromosomal replication initiation ATPase DnaA
VSQLFFDFYDSKNIDNFKSIDFLKLPENLDACNFLDNFFKQNNYSKNPLKSMILKGESGCGKTHLLNIYAQKYQANFISAEQIKFENPLRIFYENGFFIIDDFCQIEDEEKLLQYINCSTESKAFLIIVFNQNKIFELKDLQSRVKNIASCQINQASLDSLKQVFINILAKKQIDLSTQIINFIFTNISQDYSSLTKVVKQIDFFCRENDKKFNLINAKEILKIGSL